MNEPLLDDGSPRFVHVVTDAEGKPIPGTELEVEWFGDHFNVKLRNPLPATSYYIRTHDRAFKGAGYLPL